MAEHPTLTQFKAALDKQEVNDAKAAEFDRWRNGPKCPGDVKVVADELWARYEANPEEAQRKRPRLQATPPAQGSVRQDRGTPRGGNRGPAGAVHGPARGGGAGGARAPSQQSSTRGPRPDQRYDQTRGAAGAQPRRADNASAGEPSILGQPFHNPYTFLPFAPNPPRRHPPTLLTIDEVEPDRFTGVIDIEVKLLSPLLTADPEPVREDGGHRTHAVLAIGNDVIVPATGVRGALRSLLTVLTGGTLGHIDEEAWLCQGRDARLGPAGKQSRGDVPDRCFLAEVVRAGGVYRDGTVRLGKTRRVVANDLERVAAASGIRELPRPKAGKPIEHLWTNKELTVVARQHSDATPWKLKLSGRPVNREGKREGLFLAEDRELSLPAQLWAAYHGRNRHGDHPELRAGDLVWLEPADIGCQEITRAEDVKSIQWARWGRTGERLLDVVDRHHSALLPDALNPDGLVDEVTDLFGQVPRDDLKKEVNRFGADPRSVARAFTGRVRPGNLVFADAKRHTKDTTLAPLSPPHAGCAAFYRQLSAPNDLGAAADSVSNHRSVLRGYKVYRTTNERGKTAPWAYDTQPVYDDSGRPKPAQQKVNKTCALLSETCPAGKLRVTVRALSRRELMLVLAACSVDWRLGGGKPLGLGHCRVVSLMVRELRDDGTLGEPCTISRSDEAVAQLPSPWDEELRDDAQLAERLALWQASQAPVALLRYPRAVAENRNKKNRGGHVWFQRHAQPKKAATDGAHPVGLQTLHLHEAGDLAKRAGQPRLRAQPLPAFDPLRPEADTLYGHDLLAGEGEEWSEQGRDRRTHHKKLEPFDPNLHARASDRTGGGQGQNRDTRRGDRDRGRRR